MLLSLGKSKKQRGPRNNWVCLIPSPNFINHKERGKCCCHRFPLSSEVHMPLPLRKHEQWKVTALLNQGFVLDAREEKSIRWSLPSNLNTIIPLPQWLTALPDGSLGIWCEVPIKIQWNLYCIKKTILNMSGIQNRAQARKKHLAVFKMINTIREEVA